MQGFTINYKRITMDSLLSIQWPRVLCYDLYLHKILINAKRPRWRSEILNLKY
jgi:hypothetical protein